LSLFFSLVAGYGLILGLVHSAPKAKKAGEVLFGQRRPSGGVGLQRRSEIRQGFSAPMSSRLLEAPKKVEINLLPQTNSVADLAPELQNGNDVPNAPH